MVMKAVVRVKRTDCKMLRQENFCSKLEECYETAVARPAGRSDGRRTLLRLELCGAFSKFVNCNPNCHSTARPVF